MAKYVISEMDRASASIKNWANENVETLDKKINGLENMIQDESNSGELLKNIKQYASYDISGLNSLINGLEVFDANFNKAAFDYKFIVGQDIDTDDLNRRISENKQLMDNYNNQLSNIPKDDPITPFKEFNLLRNINALNKINANYSDLIEKFNEWNRAHSDDLKEASEIISDSATVLKNLTSTPYDSVKGYDLDKIDINSISLLQSDSINKLLLAKNYITENGDITESGYEFLGDAFKNELDGRTLTLSTKMMLYIDSEEELERVLQLGYCSVSSKEWDEMGHKWVYKWQASENFRTILTATQLTLSADLKYNGSNYSDEDMEYMNTRMMYTLAIAKTLYEAKEITQPYFEVNASNKKITVNVQKGLVIGARTEVNMKDIGSGEGAIYEEFKEEFAALKKEEEEKNGAMLLSTVLSLVSYGTSLASHSFGGLSIANTSGTTYKTVDNSVKYGKKIKSIINDIDKFTKGNKKSNNSMFINIYAGEDGEYKEAAKKVVEYFGLQGFSDEGKGFGTYIPRNTLDNQVNNYNTIVDLLRGTHYEHSLGIGDPAFGLEKIDKDDFWNDSEKITVNMDRFLDKKDEILDSAKSNNELKDAIKKFDSDKDFK